MNSPRLIPHPELMESDLRVFVHVTQHFGILRKGRTLKQHVVGIVELIICGCYFTLSVGKTGSQHLVCVY